MGADWGRYSGGEAGRRLEGHAKDVFALAECSGRICSGSSDGSIRVWSIATLQEERVIDNGNDAVWSLAVWEGELISGHGSGRIRVWDVASGERRQELEGHANSVNALCVCGSRLASGSTDRTIKGWGMGPGLEWVFQRTLEEHDHACRVGGQADQRLTRPHHPCVGPFDGEAGGHPHWPRQR
jgi:WD40 repeat protein